MYTSVRDQEVSVQFVLLGEFFAYKYIEGETACARAVDTVLTFFSRESSGSGWEREGPGHCQSL